MGGNWDEKSVPAHLYSEAEGSDPIGVVLVSGVMTT